MSALETVAIALDIPLAELAAEVPVVAAVTEEPPGARGLRRPSGVHTLRAMLDGPPARALRTLRTRTHQAWELTRAGRHTELTPCRAACSPT